MQMVKSSVAGDMITRLTHIQKEIGDLVEDVEILSDEDLMRAIEESEKDFDKGRYYTLKTDEDVDEFFRDLEKE
ncbi:MAG: hypothetical protein GQ567_07615 [Methanosarcinales archaeon]|nr:hypothetical protein [Methanosarcinales archaeon]